MTECTVGSRDSVVGRVTHYELDSLGFTPAAVRNFLHTHSNWPWGPPSLLYNEYWISFPGGKSSQGVALITYPHLAPRLKKRLELNFYSLCGSSVPVKCELYLYYPCINYIQASFTKMLQG